MTTDFAVFSTLLSGASVSIVLLFERDLELEGERIDLSGVDAVKPMYFDNKPLASFGVDRPASVVEDVELGSVSILSTLWFDFGLVRFFFLLLLSSAPRFSSLGVALAAMIASPIVCSGDGRGVEAETEMPGSSDERFRGGLMDEEEGAVEEGGRLGW